jgi:hypothetical protein
MCETTSSRQARVRLHRKSTGDWASAIRLFFGQHDAASLAGVCQLLPQWKEKSWFFSNYFIYECFQVLYRHFDEFFKAKIEIDREEDNLEVKSSNRTKCNHRSTDIDKDPFYFILKIASNHH